MVGCFKVLSGGILYSCSYPPRSGQDVPGNLQQDNVLHLFCLYMNELLKVRALRMGFLYISGYRQSAFTKDAEPA